MINLTNSEYNFSCYENLYASEAPQREFDINDLIEVIKYGYLKEPIEILRAISVKEVYNKKKATTLPAVTLSGIFKERNNKGLKEHSGLMQIDIDHVENYNETFQKVIADPYTYVAFKSPGGKGVKAVVKINPSETTHLEQFYALELYYKEEYNIEIDTACKDVARCMLLSYDPDLFCNPFSEVFAELFMPKKKEVHKVQHATTHLNLNATDEEGVIEQIVQGVEKGNIDITAGYENWIKIGYAISSILGDAGRTYFHRLSSLNSEYSANKCDRQYTYLNKNNNGSISLGTLIYYARENNIEIHFPSENQEKTENLHESKKKDVKFSESDRNTLQQKSNIIALSEKEKHLALKLKQLRSKLCREKGIEPYIIFGNSTLTEIVQVKPRTKNQLLGIKGIGQVKVDWFGDKIIEKIEQIFET